MTLFNLKRWFSLLAVTCLGSTLPPGYSGYSASVCLPFVNAQKTAFQEPPMLRFSVGGGPVKTVIMDTGSVGIVIAYDQIPDYQKLKTQSGAQPGFQYLSSSKILWVGTWVPVEVDFYQDGNVPVATATVPVLGVEQHGVCPVYKNDGKCPPPGKLSSAAGADIVYMGVGFGRQADGQPQGTPEKNPLLNLTRIAGESVVGKFSPGYIIGSTGVTVGLTPANTAGFGFIKLECNPDKTDWMPASMCVEVNGSDCLSGNVLVDTGVSQIYMSFPGEFPKTVPALDPSDPLKKKMVNVFAPGTTVAVYLPAETNPVAVDQFTVSQDGQGTPAPLVIPQQRNPPFVNTGRTFLRNYQFLYDARNGVVGLKKQTDGCAQVR